MSLTLRINAVWLLTWVQSNTGDYKTINEKVNGTLAVYWKWWGHHWIYSQDSVLTCAQLMPLWRKPGQYPFPVFLSTQYRLWCCVPSYSVQYTRYTRKTEPSPTELSSCGSSEQIPWHPGPLLTWVKVIPGQSVLKAHSCGFLDAFHADHCGKPWHRQLIRRLASALPADF